MATEFTIENPIFLEENLISGVSLDMVVSAVKAGGRAWIDESCGVYRVLWRKLAGNYVYCSEDEEFFISDELSLTIPIQLLDIAVERKMSFNLANYDPFWASELGFQQVNLPEGEIQKSDFYDRMVAIQDYSQIESIMRQIFDMAGPNCDLYELMIQTGGHVGGIYTVDEKLVGFTTVLGTFNDQTKEPGFLLDMIGILPDYQGIGIGQLAVKAIALIGMTIGTKTIELTFDPTNKRLASFYTGLGFVPVKFYRALYGEGYDRFAAILDLGNPMQIERLIKGRTVSMIAENVKIKTFEADLDSILSISHKLNLGNINILDFEDGEYIAVESC